MRASLISCGFLLGVGGCGERSMRVVDPEIPAQTEAVVASDKMTEKTAGTPPSEDIIRAQLARAWAVAPEAITIRYPIRAEVPGARLFHARAGAPAERGGHELNGLATADALLVEDEARTAMAAAWGYGAARTVPPRTVAQAMAHVHAARDQSSAVVTDLALGAFKGTVSPEAAALAILPEEVMVDGLPAVRFVLRSSARGFRASIATAVFHPAGKVEMRFERLP